MKQIFKFNRHAIVIFVATIMLCSCKKLTDVPAPYTSITGNIVFEDDLTAAAAVTDIYSKFVDASSFAGGGLRGFSLLTGLSSDEFILGTNVTAGGYRELYLNQLQPTSDIRLWDLLYGRLYPVNAAIEGLNKSTKLTESVKKQLLGETKFFRAYIYFYLVNLFGDVPLQTSTDWTVAAVMPRTPISIVYKQIIADLTESKSLLSETYLNGNLAAYTSSPERVRLTKSAAGFLLSRVHLYLKDWASAEAEATPILDNVAVYDTVPLNNVFLKNSKEAIWQLQPISANKNTEDGSMFLLTASGLTNTQPVHLSNFVTAAFETSDQRKVEWTKSMTIGTDTYTMPFKYKLGANTTNGVEYAMAFRIAELYLIRSEARARLSNFTGAQADLNIIRKRARLGNTGATDGPSLLLAIERERRVELFTEGQRWFDLKRTDRANTIMPAVCSTKGSVWQPEWQLYPIAASSILNNPQLIQNPGYQ